MWGWVVVPILLEDSAPNQLLLAHTLSFSLPDLIDGGLSQQPGTDLASVVTLCREKHLITNGVCQRCP